MIGLVALAGFFLLTPPDDIIMGQAEATQVRISGKVPGRIASYRFGEGDQVKAGITPSSKPKFARRKFSSAFSILREEAINFLPASFTL